MALVAAVKSFGWERVSILAVHEAADRELLLQVQRQARSSGLQVSVTAEYEAPRFGALCYSRIWGEEREREVKVV